MKQIANIVTFLRIPGSAALLFTEPLSTPFWLVYALCGISDMLDGCIARKTGAVSKAGALLDSAADLVFIAAALWVFIPLMPLTPGLVGWTAGIALIRSAALAVGYLRYRTFAALHTWANKAVGLALFCFPFFLNTAGIPAAYIVLTLASLSAFEELLIQLTSRRLDRDRRSLFTK